MSENGRPPAATAERDGRRVIAPVNGAGRRWETVILSDGGVLMWDPSRTSREEAEAAIREMEASS